MLDLHIDHIGDDLVAVCIRNDALVGRLINAAVRRHRQGKGVGFCTGNHGGVIVLHGDPGAVIVADIPLIGQRGSTLCRHSKGPQIVCGVQRIVLAGGMIIRHLCNHALGLLQNQDGLLAVKFADRANAVFVIDMGCLVGDMTGCIAVSAITPVMGIADFPGVFGCGSMGAARVQMDRSNMLIQIAVAAAAIRTVAAFCLFASLTADFAQ